MTKIDLASPIEVNIKEYLCTGDLEEAVRSLRELNIPENHPQFVKKCLYFGMDNQAYERELISKLLSHFYGKVIAPKAIEGGFQLALDSLEDMSLDIPEATDLLSKFLARAVVDEIIPPIFLSQARGSNPKAKNALHLANALATENHGGERLAHIWGPGDLRSVKRLKEEVNCLLEEFLTTNDCTEAEKCIRKLNAPSFHYQVVKQALRLMLDKRSAETTRKLMDLLKYLARVNLVSPEHFAKGFRCCFNSLEDIKLDVPNADEMLREITETAKSEKILPPL